MKGRILGVFAFVFLVFGGVAFATTGEVSGQIDTIRSHDTWVSPDWISISGVTGAGGCSFTVNGSVIFYVRDNERGKRQLELAQAAKLAGKAVVIGYDDVNLTLPGNIGQCFVRYIDLK